MKGTRADYSDEQAHRIAYLIAGYIRKTLTVTEHDELDAWVEASDENMRLFEELTDEQNMEANLVWMERVQTEKKLQQIRSGLSFTSERKANKKRALWPLLVAASILLAVAVYFITTSPPEPSIEVAQTPTLNGDVPPGGARATLTLSDGSVIDLAQASNGLLKQEGGAAILKTGEGSLAYRGEAPVGNANPYHQLTTPIGGQYALTLSDGTRVWLNAASSLHFPAQFTSGERRVELSGEGYFEVAKDAKKPFVVQLPEGAAIRVLGTHFNASAYGDEPIQHITLVEGAVEVRSKNNQVRLRPNQQASVSKGTIAVTSQVDVAAATGWKEGAFVFHNADIQTIMGQVKRWYDVKVVFNVQTSEHFNATISRGEPLSKLLRLLELTGKIHFKIENKTVYVLP